MRTIRDIPTFDPLAYADFSAAITLREAVSVWRLEKRAFLIYGGLSTLPLVAGVLLDPWLRALTGCLSLILLTAVVAPCVARRMRGLDPDIGGTLREVAARLPAVIGAALVALGVAAAPSALAALVAPGHPFTAALVMLPVGLLAAAPLSMSVPVAAAEGLGVAAALRRSRALVRGRLGGVLAMLALAGILVVLADALPLLWAPSASLATLLVRPLLVGVAAVTIGALYTCLYDR